MASSGKIIKGLDQFMDQMKVMRSDDLYKILHKAEIKALTRPRDKIAGIYAGFKGKHDLNQTQSELNSRWRAAKHQPIHPIRESRIGIAQNIYHNRIRPKNIGKNDASVWARIFGHTRNSWLIEHGRYRDPSRAYTGWQIFRNFFKTYGVAINAQFTQDVGYGIDKVFARIAKEMNRAAR